MSKPYETKDEKLLYPERRYLREDDERSFVREDELTSDIIERGIAMRNMYGNAYAVRFLREKQISPDVIRRVLAEGDRKRGGKD